MIKYKSRILPSIDKLDISFRLTKIIDCKTEEYAEILIDKLSRLKNAKFNNILIPEFDYSLDGVIVTQEIEYIKGDKCGMIKKRYRDKIYKDLVEGDSDWTFNDYNFNNFIVCDRLYKIYAIDFQSYNFMPSRQERKNLWETKVRMNNIIIEEMTRDLPFRKKT
tara:strand:- start:4086 stop:4577 length:492 start_codon:yes stop_codon:yes gene_type:complete